MRTRKKIAAELWARLQRGPQFGGALEELTGAEAEARCRGWLDSWIVDDVARLVPELRDKLDEIGIAGYVRQDERPQRSRRSS